MLGKIWHWIQHFAACQLRFLFSSVCQYDSFCSLLRLQDIWLYAQLEANLWFCLEGSGVTKGEVETSAPGTAFWGRKLRLECHVTTTKCQMSADASNYDLQNVECKSLIPSCKISWGSPRFAKGAITSLSDALRQCFSTFLGLRHPTKKNNNLRHP